MATEFRGIIRRTADESRVRDATTAFDAGRVASDVIRAAAIEFMTDGPYPYDQLASLVGRRIKVTVID